MGNPVALIAAVAGLFHPLVCGSHGSAQCVHRGHRLGPRVCAVGGMAAGAQRIRDGLCIGDSCLVMGDPVGPSYWKPKSQETGRLSICGLSA